MKNKNSLKIISVTLVVIAITSFALYHSFQKKQKDETPITYITPSYPYDISTPEKAINTRDYVFVARINNIIKTEYKAITVDNHITSEPYTTYSVSIITNLKGDLSTTKETQITQYGGVNKDQESYTFYDNCELLEIGKTYILMPELKDESLYLSLPEYMIKLDVNNSASFQEIKQDEIYQIYVEASNESATPSLITE